MTDATNTTVVQTKELTPEQEFALMKKLGGRKFIFSMTALIAASILMWFSKIEGGIYSVIVVSVSAAFMTGNVVQSIQSPKTVAD